MPGDKPLRIVHFLNQFFGGIGGEEAANVGVQLQDGPVGPGRALAQAAGEEGTVFGTIIAGDNFFNEQAAEAGAGVREALDRYKPDVLIAGPAFNAGRYGLACVEVCRLVSEQGIPAVTAMFRDNPGVLGDRQNVYIVPTAESASDVAGPMAAMLRIAGKLARGAPVGSAEAEGYIPTGTRVPGLRDKPAADRAYDMLVSRLNGGPYTTEMAMLVPERVVPATPVRGLGQATVALLTTGGLVPKGNPDRLVRAGARNWFRYSVEGLEALSPTDWESVHAGFYTEIVNRNPNYILPLDTLRDMEKEKVFGRLHESILSTTGVGTTLADGKRIGQEMARELESAGVSAVIMVAT